MVISEGNMLLPRGQTIKLSLKWKKKNQQRKLKTNKQKKQEGENAYLLEKRTFLS